jgi:uncharacterized protein YyaL (SSP411 family)
VEENKPIFLSIGYSACHWCHVMERESFENEGTAALMNQLFVNIKVDREERPDLDEIYMRAVQAITGSGGWPMSMFLTPSGEPFYGGTYFPPGPRYGMPGFPQVLQSASKMYAEQSSQIERMTARLSEMLEQTGRLPSPEAALQGDWLERVVAGCESHFDTAEGGFRGTPKFPPHGTLAIWLADHHRRPEGGSLAMATQTLDGMARGGMYDLLAGGFARYSVDGEWRIPHFEKMLYDNGQLIPLYVDGYLATGDPHYARVARQSVGWMLREMRLDHGGFAASQDADSEGEEGKFFCWTQHQLRSVLGDAKGDRVAALLNVTELGSFEHGTSALRLDEPLEKLGPGDRSLLESALPSLLTERAKRIAPDRDDKVITAWNALAISALARGAVGLGEPAWAEAAAVTARFLLDEVTVKGRLMRTFKDGRAHVLALADDHSFLLVALIDLYQASFEHTWLEAALDLASRTIDLFWDDKDSGLFYTGRDAETLVNRSKHMMAGAEPSANGMAALGFAKLATLCERADLGEKADIILRAYQPLVEAAPRGLGAEAVAAAWRTGPVKEVGVVGDMSAPQTQALLRAIAERHDPFRVVTCLRPGTTSAVVPWMNARTEVELPTAYVCQNHSCRLPVTTPEELSAELAGGR